MKLKTRKNVLPPKKLKKTPRIKPELIPAKGEFLLFRELNSVGEIIIVITKFMADRKRINIKHP